MKYFLLLLVSSLFFGCGTLTPAEHQQSMNDLNMMMLERGQPIR